MKIYLKQFQGIISTHLTTVSYISQSEKGYHGKRFCLNEEAINIKAIYYISVNLIKQ